MPARTIDRNNEIADRLAKGESVHDLLGVSDKDLVSFPELRSGIDGSKAKPRTTFGGKTVGPEWEAALIDARDAGHADSHCSV